MHFDYEEKSWMKPPATSLVLEHIYGVQTADRRSTVMYMHSYGQVEQSKSEQQKRQI
jgi:hypothetical protein